MLSGLIDQHEFMSTLEVQRKLDSIVIFLRKRRPDLIKRDTSSFNVL